MRITCTCLGLIVLLAAAPGCGGSGEGAGTSVDATLSALAISAGNLAPTFSPPITSYTAVAGVFGASVEIVPTTSDPAATVRVNGTPVPSGASSGPLPLAASPAPTPIDVAVTAADGTTTIHYAVVFTRAATAVQEAYIKTFAQDDSDLLGGAVAISGDTMVVGASQEDGSATTVNGPDDDAAPGAGAAYVFVRTAGSWSQQAYLKAANQDADDRFGTGVAISGDTIVVGAPLEDGSATTVNGPDDDAADGAGAAYVFVRNAGVWSQQAYLKASNAGAGDQLGTNISISGDTIVIGAVREDGSAAAVNGVADDAAPEAGAAYVFVRSAGAWSQQAYLKAFNTDADDGFGGSVSISGDTIAVSAFLEDGSATTVNGPDNDAAQNAGAAYVFVRNAGVWSQQAYLKASNTQPFDFFGSVAISGDTIVVGAFDEDGSATTVDGADDDAALNAGAAYVFVRSAGVWSQQAYLKPFNTESFDRFGNVAISGDTIVVGAFQEDGTATTINGADNNDGIQVGAAYVFVRNAGVWSQQAYLKASNSGGGDFFGISIAISGDTVVVGSNGEDGSATTVNGADDNAAVTSGAAYIFR